MRESLYARNTVPCDIVALGRVVIDAEAAALARLAAMLDHKFERAVSRIVDTTGRVVVSGMGKSGHVAGKVAATLASIGVPALYLHPAEAAHGDLGMLVAGDTLLVLSNSGATRELLPVVQHARARHVPVIAIGACPGSLLMQRADIALLLPDVEEAGPAKLAPTTSTAMMMALGDALAMAAMERRGWSRLGFGALHPGGTLGRALGRVTTIMHSGGTMPLVRPATPMREVLVTMTACSFGIAGVQDGEERLVGVITDGDLRRHADVLMEATAEAVMTCSPVTIAASELAESALALMKLQNVTALFVMDDAVDGRPVGIVHVHDFLRLGLS